MHPEHVAPRWVPENVIQKKRSATVPSKRRQAFSLLSPSRAGQGKSDPMDNFPEPGRMMERIKTRVLS